MVQEEEDCPMESTAEVLIPRPHRQTALVDHPLPAQETAGECFWKAAGLCHGLRRVEAEGRMVCVCAERLMAPSPVRVLETLTDLGLSDEQIAHYFHIPTRCLTALRRPH